MKKNENEVVANVTLADEAIADGRPKAILFGRKVRRPDISGKMVPFASAHRVPFCFFRDECAVTVDSKRPYRV